MKINSKILFPLVLLFVFFIFLILVINSNSKKFKSLSVGSSNIKVEIADTDAKRTHGLSNRKSLADNAGMLFIFPNSGIYPFWMKDMHFPLDFIWISQNKVADLTLNVPNPKKPNDELPLYSPREPIDMVLEVNAGFIEKYHIKIGDSVEY